MPLGTIDLTGYACYQVYITMENEDDFLGSISGDAMNSTYVTTTTDFYHSANWALGFRTASTACSFRCTLTSLTTAGSPSV